MRHPLLFASMSLCLSLFVVAGCGGSGTVPGADGAAGSDVVATTDGAGPADSAGVLDAWTPADVPSRPDAQGGPDAPFQTDVPGPPDVRPDGPCVRLTCAGIGAGCGEWQDGCGGIVTCGACPIGRDCVAGQCACASHLETRCHQQDVWWFDGCGQPEERFVDCDFDCVAGACTGCTPDCADRDCGQDPLCGSSCGTCLAGERCGEAGLCLVDDACPGVPLATDGVLDLDIHAVRVSGRVTVDGVDLPDEDAQRGELWFVAASTGAFLRVPLLQEGPFLYEITLPPDDYEIRLDANETLCSNDATPGVPCVDGPLLADVRLRSDGVLDIDIPTVRIEGAVTLDTAALPAEDGERGRLRFTLDGGGFVDTEGFGASGAARYRLRLLRGTYRVDWRGERDRCLDDREPAVPCNEGPVLTNVRLTMDGVLDVNLGAVRVEGAVTQDGATLPAAEQDRGALWFDLDGGEPFETDHFDANNGATGGARYGVTLLPGTYAVRWHGNEALCQTATAAPVACNEGTLLTNLNLRQDGVLDIDVPTVRVEGAVTVNQGAMETEVGERGWLRFVLRGESEVDLRPLGASGTARYAVRLLKGRYDIRWDGQEARCLDDAEPTVPCNDGVVLVDIPLTNDGVLDVDLPTVRVEGAVTVNQAAMGTASRERGRLRFVLRDGWQLDTEPFGASGAARYGVTILEGRYEVRWEPDPALCDGDAHAVAPCNPGVVLPSLLLTNDGVLDVDIPAVDVQGAVTLESAALPTETADRGHLVWLRKGDTEWDAPPFGASGPETYRVTLLSGRYVVRHRANPALCADGAPESAVPCLDSVLAGCNELPGQ